MDESANVSSRGSSLVDKYISEQPSDVRKILKELRSRLKKIAPGAKEDVRYGIPTIRFRDRNLVHYAAFAKHVGFYPTPSAIKAFKSELSAYESSKGAIRFSLSRPLPYSLIKKIIIFRLKESSSAPLKPKRAT